jgi:hypothetical protein
MARINIDDQGRNDPRLKILGSLLGTSRFDARGRMEELWAYCTDRQTYEIEPHMVAVLSEHESFASLMCDPRVNLGEVLANGNVYVRGTKGRIEWLGARRKAAKKGGKARAKSGKRKEDGTFQGNLASSQTSRQTSSQTPANDPGQSSALTLALAPSLALVNYSVRGEVATRPAAKDFSPVGLWMRNYQITYGVRYELQGKDTGMLTNLAKGRTAEQLDTLFACYLAIEEKLYREQKHPLSLFFRDLQKISVAAKTGIDPSKPASFDVSKLKD